MLNIDDLLKRLNSPDEEMRREAIEGLLDVSFEPKILPLLKKAIGDESWRVRKSAVNVGVSFHEPAAVAAIVPLMIALLHAEDNAGLRNSAVECLTRFGIKSAPYLIQNLNDKDHDVRKFIADILSDIWTRKGDQVLDQGIVDALIIAIDDHNENVRLSAIEGLGKIGSNKAVQALLKILEKGDSTLKFTTLEALGNIGRPIPMKGVYSALSDKFLKRAAYDLIGKVGGAEAVPYLMDGLQEISTSTREAAIAAIYTCQFA
jgi:HEAT repeat protein